MLKIQSSESRRVLSGLDGAEPGDVWSTQVCKQAVPVSDLILQPGVDAGVDMTWHPFPADEPGPDLQYCPGTREWLEPGKFKAFAAALGGDPTSSTFVLH